MINDMKETTDRNSKKPRTRTKLAMGNGIVLILVFALTFVFSPGTLAQDQDTGDQSAEMVLVQTFVPDVHGTRNRNLTPADSIQRLNNLTDRYGKAEVLRALRSFLENDLSEEARNRLADAYPGSTHDERMRMVRKMFLRRVTPYIGRSDALDTALQSLVNNDDRSIDVRVLALKNRLARSDVLSSIEADALGTLKTWVQSDDPNLAAAAADLCRRLRTPTVLSDAIAFLDARKQDLRSAGELDWRVADGVHYVEGSQKGKKVYNAWQTLKTNRDHARMLEQAIQDNTLTTDQTLDRMNYNQVGWFFRDYLPETDTAFPKSDFASLVEKIVNYYQSNISDTDRRANFIAEKKAMAAFILKQYGHSVPAGFRETAVDHSAVYRSKRRELQHRLYLFAEN